MEKFPRMKQSKKLLSLSESQMHMVELKHPLLSQIEPLNQKWGWEEESLTRGSSPGPEKKIQKPIYSPPVRNSPENLSTTIQSTSKSQSTICSVCKDYLSSPTLSGSKYCRGRQLTSTLSSQQSTQPSPTTEQQRHLGTLNSDLDIQNRPKQSGTTRIGLLRIAHSSAWCSSSIPTESQNSYNTVSTSPLTLHLPMQEGKTRSSNLTRQSDAGLDPLTACHLTSLRSSDSSKCDTSSVRQQGTKVHQ